MKQQLLFLTLLLFLTVSGFAQRANPDALANRNAKLEILLLEYKEQLHKNDTRIKELYSKNRTLKKEINSLMGKKNKTGVDIEQLMKERNQLLSNKLQIEKTLKQRDITIKLLEDTNRKLQKDNAVLQTNNVNAKGLRLKNNGDRRGINVAKRTEFIEVCFDIVKNEVCEPGANRFYLRLINPSGAVVSDPNRGSGKLTLFDETESISYTTSKIFEYNPSVKNLCMEWYAYPNTPFIAGRYRIELFNKGRKVGTYNFDTK